MITLVEIQLELVWKSDLLRKNSPRTNSDPPEQAGLWPVPGLHQDGTTTLSWCVPSQN